jgi:hypothetical protein
MCGQQQVLLQLGSGGACELMLKAASFGCHFSQQLAIVHNEADGTTRRQAIILWSSGAGNIIPCLRGQLPQGRPSYLHGRNRLFFLHLASGANEGAAAALISSKPFF